MTIAIAAIWGRKHYGEQCIRAAGEITGTPDLFIYHGISVQCPAAQWFKPADSCLGLGVCAGLPLTLSMGPEGLPQVDEDRCSGCGVWRPATEISSACPRVIRPGLVQLPAARTVSRACGGIMGCGLCAGLPSGSDQHGRLPGCDRLEKCDDAVCVENAALARSTPPQAAADNAARPEEATA